MVARHIGIAAGCAGITERFEFGAGAGGGYAANAGVHQATDRLINLCAYVRPIFRALIKALGLFLRINGFGWGILFVSILTCADQ